MSLYCVVFLWCLTAGVEAWIRDARIQPELRDSEHTERGGLMGLEAFQGTDYDGQSWNLKLDKED